MLDIREVLTQVVANGYFVLPYEKFGDEGNETLLRLISAIKTVFALHPPDQFTGSLVVFSRCASPVLVDSIEAVQLADIEIDLAGRSQAILEIRTDESVWLHANSNETIEQLSQYALVYEYADRAERFIAKGVSKYVPKHDPTAHSQFCIPTISSLSAALNAYALECVKESSCFVFRTVWPNESRHYLRAKPESIMRNSLLQFLRNRVGGRYDVQAEHVVDESHPVDVIVTPRQRSNHSVLIEVKWLGKSIDENNVETTTYTASRARDGCLQLRNYIDEQRRSTPYRKIHGYLVVVDARRRGLTPATQTLGPDDALHYEGKEIDFQSIPIQDWPDFEQPIRMFARPKI